MILIAVILFAALSYAITKSGSGNASSISQEKLAIEYAAQQQILTAAATALQKMEMYGCHAGNSYFSWNPVAPPPPETDKNCIFFSMHGGPVAALKHDYEATLMGLIVFDSSMPGIGTTRDDTIIWYNFGGAAWAGGGGVPDPATPAYKQAEKLCDYINQKNGISYTVDFDDDPLEQVANTPFGANDSGTFGTFPAGFEGKSEGCAPNGPNVSFTHYLVAIER